MAQVIQNLFCSELKFDRSTRRVYLEDFALLNDKVINSIFFFTNNLSINPVIPTPSMYLPFSTEISAGNLLRSRMSDLNLFLNLFRADGSEITENLSHHLFSASRSIGVRDLLPILIHEKIDFKKSYISADLDTDFVSNLLLYVSYSDKPSQKIDDLITGCVTVRFPEIFDENENQINEICQDFVLGTFINHTLRGKKIKRITYDGRGYSYLYLKTDNALIENIPCSLISNRLSRPKGFIFQNLEIDFEQSFFRRRGVGVFPIHPISNTQEYVTFYY